MFGDRRNRDSEVGCLESERTGTVGGVFGVKKNRDSEVGHLESERTGTVRWGVWRQKEHGQWGSVWSQKEQGQ